MNHSNNHITELIKETLILTAAMAIVAGAVYFFLLPSHASVSSISGLGIILSNFVPLPLSAITMILNVLLLIIGFFTCGKEFGAKTVYTSIVLPLFLALFERIFPNIGSLTDSQELDVLCYILTVSIGLSILFNRNASSGGLDIVAKIINKYLHMDLGKAMSLSGMCVALSAALVYDKKTVVLSVLGTYFNGLVLDHFIFNHNVKRRVCIITKKENELRQFILHELYSGATVYEAIGAAVIALLCGGGFAAAVLGSYRLKRKTYRYPYESRAKVHFTRRDDQFRHRSITQRRIPREPPSGGGSGQSSVHTSGSGTSHGGGGRSL